MQDSASERAKKFNDDWLSLLGMQKGLTGLAKDRLIIAEIIAEKGSESGFAIEMKEVKIVKTYSWDLLGIVRNGPFEILHYRL